MFASILSNTTICIFALLAAAAAYSDFKSYSIPNSYSLSIILLYPAFVIASGGAIDWLPAITVAAVALSVGFILFALKCLGGGDVKLLTAVTLWAGPTLIVEFLLVTTITGGLYAASMALHRKASAQASFLPQALPAESLTFLKKPMPYGVAIGIGAVYVAFTLLR